MKHWLIRLLLIGLGLCLGLFLAELAVRYALPPQQAAVDHVTAGDELLPLHQYDRNDPLGWRLAPNRKNGLYQTNSLGFRDPERTLTHRPGVRRILLIGDSIVFGSGLPQEATFSSRLDFLLGDTCEVWNLGVSGYNSHQEALLLADALQKTTPDLILLGYCANDAGPQPMVVPRPDGGWDHIYYTEPDMPVTLPLPSFLDRWLSLNSHLYRFISLLAFRAGAGQKDQNPEFRRLSHSQRDAGLLKMKQDTDQAGIPLLSIAFPFFADASDSEKVNLHRDGLQALSRLSIPTLDLAPVYQKYETELLKLTPSDPLHLSAEGTAIISRAIVDWLMQRMEFKALLGNRDQGLGVRD